MAKYFRNWAPVRLPIVDLNGHTAGLNTSITWTEGDGATALAPNAIVTYPSHASVTNITISATGIIDAGEQVRIAGIVFPLNADATEAAVIGSTSCSIGYTAATKTFVISAVSGGILVSDAQTAVRSVSQYDHISGTITDGDRVFTFIITGDNSRQSVAAVATVSVVAAVNSPPSLLLGGATLNASAAFAEGDPTTSICTAAVLTDADDTTMPSLSFSISGTAATDDEILKWSSVEFPVGTTQTTTATAGSTTFSIAYNGTTKAGTITKSGGGEMPIGDLQTLIRSLQYVNDAVPTTGGNRVVTMTVSDGTNTSAAATITITVSSTGAPNLTAVTNKYMARGQTITPFSVFNTGGDGTFSVISGTFPSGISGTKVGSNYVVSGTVTGSGAATSDVTVQCTNAFGTNTVTFTVQTLASYTTFNSSSTFPYYTTANDRLYVLTSDVSTPATAVVVKNSGCVIDLGGNEITYNDATPITITNNSFESGTGAAATGWDFTNAPNAERWAGTFLYNEVFDGDYSIKFNDCTIDEYIESLGTITLLANTTYSISGMFEYGGQDDWDNPGVKGYVQLVGDGLPVREVAWSNTNWRGMQHLDASFTTGGTAETYHVRVGIVGHQNATRPFFIDLVKVQQFRNYGVIVSPKVLGPQYSPGVTQYGNGNNAHVVNGSLTQGQDGGTWCHGIFVYNTVGTQVFDDLVITVNGDDSQCVEGQDMTSANKPCHIRNCVLASDVQAITSRDNFNGAIVGNVWGTWEDNQILRGPHAGFRSAGGDNGTIVRRNNIQLTGRYTNGFAILAGGKAQVYDNVIDCGTGIYSSRGVGLKSGVLGTPSRCYDNIIRVQQFSNNQEYQGTPIGGAYGIQMENCSHTEVYGNTITAYGNEAPAYAFRANLSPGNVNNYVHDNYFIAIRTGSTNATRSGCYKIDGVTTGQITLENNILETNDTIIESSQAIQTMVGDHIKKTTDTGTKHPFVAQFTVGTGLHTTISFIDPTFEDAGSATYLRNAQVTNYSDNLPTTRMRFNVQWTNTIQVSNGGGIVEGAAVEVDDASATLVQSGTTDSIGEFHAVCMEFETTGSTKSTKTPHSVSVTAGLESGSGNFTSNTTQNIPITIS